MWWRLEGLQRWEGETAHARVISCYDTHPLATSSISMTINTEKRTCKDAKKALTMHGAGVIDTFRRSIAAMYVRRRPRSHRSNNTKSFFSSPYTTVYLPKR